MKGGLEYGPSLPRQSLPPTEKDGDFGCFLSRYLPFPLHELPVQFPIDENPLLSATLPIITQRSKNTTHH
jgi:hypothetical protein